MRVLSVLLVAAALLTYANAPAPSQPPQGGCVEIGVQSTGFHTSLLAPSEILDPRHPLRRLFPEARWLVVGWGDEDFFREPGGGTVGQALRAAIPGGPTVVHAIGLDVAPEQYFAADSTSRIAITRRNAAGLARFIEQELVLTPEGDAVLVSAGHHAGRSYFLRGRDETFSLFNNCNDWTARGLRAAGLPISNVLTARDVMDRVKEFESLCHSPQAKLDLGSA